LLLLYQAPTEAPIAIRDSLPAGRLLVLSDYLHGVVPNSLCVNSLLVAQEWLFVQP